VEPKNHFRLKLGKIEIPEQSEIFTGFFLLTAFFTFGTEPKDFRLDSKFGIVLSILDSIAAMPFCSVYVIGFAKFK
jgi:hypothetical protein